VFAVGDVCQKGSSAEMTSVDDNKTYPSKEERMHLRLDSKVKSRIGRAAAITGQSLTDFSVSALVAKADQILECDDTLLLTSDEYSFFLNALDDDRKPSKRSCVAARRYRRGSRKRARYHVEN
jgi:uncharacterized protein (DUF1778 family)